MVYGAVLVRDEKVEVVDQRDAGGECSRGISPNQSSLRDMITVTLSHFQEMGPTRSFTPSWAKTQVDQVSFELISMSSYTSIWKPDCEVL